MKEPTGESKGEKHETDEEHLSIAEHLTKENGGCCTGHRSGGRAPCFHSPDSEPSHNQTQSFVTHERGHMNGHGQSLIGRPSRHCSGHTGTEYPALRKARPGGFGSVRPGARFGLRSFAASQLRSFAASQLRSFAASHVGPDVACASRRNRRNRHGRHET